MRKYVTKANRCLVCLFSEIEKFTPTISLSGKLQFQNSAKKDPSLPIPKHGELNGPPTIFFPDELPPEDEDERPKVNNSVEIRLSDIITFNKLGSGASGCVKKAVHQPTKKLLALKEVTIKNDDKAREAIISELRMLEQCDHPNIIKSYGAFLTANGVTIALEYMNAGSLASILQTVGAIPERILGMITVQLLYGL